MLRFHLPCFPHTSTVRAKYPWCAYLTKCLNFAEMMESLGHEVFIYSGEDNDARCTEHIPVITTDQQSEWFGHYQWDRDVFNGWDANAVWWQTMNQRAIEEIQKRIKPHDFVCIIAGLCQKQIADAFPAHMAVEWGIGYQGVFAPYRVFESYAWMHHVAGLQNKDDVRFFDTVIPNSFRTEDFPEGKGGDYFLFIGRFIKRKGVEIAVETTKRIGAKLIMAGQGVISNGDGYRGIDVHVRGDHLQHVGVVGPEQRAKLMGGAKAIFVPTTYLEPFGGVSIEANMCGTPCIVTDYGVFAETIGNGVNGYRCRTLSDFINASLRVDKLNRGTIRKLAIDKYSTDNIRYRYETYFERLLTLWRDGWYSV